MFRFLVAKNDVVSLNPLNCFAFNIIFYWHPIATSRKLPSSY